MPNRVCHQKKKCFPVLPCYPPFTIEGVIKQNFPAYFPLSTLVSLLGRPCPFFARSLTLDHFLRVAVRAQNPQYVDNAVVPSKSSGTGFPCQRHIVVPCLRSIPPPISISVIRVAERWLCRAGHHGACFLVSSIRPGKCASSSCIVGRMGSRNFFKQVEHFLRHLRILQPV
jgi:hypothetical protein